MMQFKVFFHRYGNGGSRLSSAAFVNATDFDGALAMANAMLTGMKDADLANRYIVASIETTGLRGEQADGPGLWETSAEFTARMAVRKVA